MRSVRWFTALVVTVVVVFCGQLFVPYVASAADGTTVNLSESVNVRDQTPVTVSGTIAGDHQFAGIAECVSDIIGDPQHFDNYCDETSHPLGATTAGQTYSVPVVARSTITQSPYSFDCLSYCVFAVLVADNGVFSVAGSRSITFSDAPVDDATGTGDVSTYRSSRHQTAIDPVGTRVITNGSESVSILEQAPSTSAPTGYTYIGQEVVVTTSSTPSRSAFTAFNLDDSIIPSGETKDSLVVFHDGVAVRDCSVGIQGPRVQTLLGVPQPCVYGRDIDRVFNGTTLEPTGILLNVSDVAGTWNFATGPAATPRDDLIIPTVAPPYNYANGQSLAVSGTIHEPFAQGTVALCQRTVVANLQFDASMCSTEGYATDTNPNPSLSYSGNIVVRETATAIDGSSVDCASDGDGCSLVYLAGPSVAAYEVKAAFPVEISHDAAQTPDSASGTVTAGGSISTHPSDGQTASDPQGTQVVTPNGGSVSIDEAATTGTPPTGYGYFGQQVTINAPDASVASPLRLTLYIDSSIVPGGETAESLQLFRDGVAIADCADGSGTAAPDPCISSRQTINGDLVLTALSSHASVWNVGTRTK